METVYIFDYDCHAEVAFDLPRFIDEVYNTKRLHSALGYGSPEDFETRHVRQGVNSPP